MLSPFFAFCWCEWLTFVVFDTWLEKSLTKWRGLFAESLPGDLRTNSIARSQAISEVGCWFSWQAGAVCDFHPLDTASQTGDRVTEFF
jgi:hypothetical protein